MAKWITFGEPESSSSRKTLIWPVYATDDGGDIGEVKWYGPWRKYAFFPASCTVFEKDCLRDIADFCEQRTQDHRRSK